jgi:DNA primase
MKHEHLTYPEAIKQLGKKYGIEIVEKEKTPEDIQAQNIRESLYHINAFAQKHFAENLFGTDEGKSVGLTYFKERGFNEAAIQKFQLGYSPARKDDLVKYALQNGYLPEQLENSGLGIKKDLDLYDRFRERVIFPIHNLTGRVVGFGGRILTSDKNKPKYINSPETEIYNKSHILYGIYFAKNSIASKNSCYLVEGYTDVISLHQAGIENVVASSGTSLTTGQVRLIKRFTENITILYDGDPAGIKASLRGVDIILEEGLNVKVVLFPEGEDPDSFARKNRAAVVEDYIAGNATNFIIFKTRLLLEEAREDIEENAIEFETKWGKCMGIESSNDSTIKLGQKLGYNLVIKKDPELKNIRIKAAPLPEIDLTKLHKKIKENDEQGTWYLHPGKHMLLNGSKKHIGQKPSPLSLKEVIKLAKSIK